MIGNRGLQGSSWRERPWETCREHHLKDWNFLMVGNSNLTPSMSYSFRPLWLCRCLPFLISLKCSPPILCPGWPNPMPYLPLSFSSPENYIKCHPLHKHSRVSLGLPAAPMVLDTHLLQLLHIVLWLLNRSYPGHACPAHFLTTARLGTWGFRDSLCTVTLLAEWMTKAFTEPAGKRKGPNTKIGKEFVHLCV